ncbi:ribosomal-processing cysteine protease Prp [Schinkia azotoformans]|uniref:ribosomal-processing cysteine protease Prp n=1 Tax=Schinkia azotoformans TaxID=1454 RepID=UPI002DBB4CC8|nr:ribosomal-processing cysteine protease Prp [Schinkia azotoformans]MEC1743308.1 ribosomal-processing cysteine protease Prp [Schinkia azotoformans]MEC1769272.1 ribosomal-processing cysteine protease Prp [Schinkia azotoformans]MED4377358.1 ribosomal-processing cysteine protease Prp [Schinkia azotoformans]MED4420195.1 ribosomal-processing cysteine protease Prp [Schinkia azotoformans]
MIYKYGEKHIVFTDEVVNKLESYKQKRKEQHESGGILLGKVYKDLIVVDTISEPSIEDQSGRYFFKRDVQKAQKIIKVAWEKSRGERIYLGEWHTHPEDNPIPSSDDSKLINNMLKDSHMEIDFLVMVIIGIVSPHIAVQRKGQKICEPLPRVSSKDGLKIILYENQQGKIMGFKVLGYLNIAPLGYDIYNAAFSQIFYGSINSIYSLTGVTDYSLEKASNFIRFFVPDIDNSKDKDKIYLLFESMYIQIQMVQEEMQLKNLSNFVKVNFEKLI